HVGLDDVGAGLLRGAQARQVVARPVRQQQERAPRGQPRCACAFIHPEDSSRGSKTMDEPGCRWRYQLLMSTMLRTRPRRTPVPSATGARRGRPDGRVQLLLIAAAWLLYFGIRAVTQGSSAAAERHARDMVDLEETLRVHWEPAIQRV